MPTITTTLEEGAPTKLPPAAPNSLVRFWLTGQAVGAWLADRLWLLIPFFALAALWPFYAEGLPRSYDGALHLLRSAALDQHLRQGMLYPRWTPELMLGQGYPVFSFYGPATYYLVVFLHWAGLSLPNAFVGAFALQVVVAGLGMYWLAQDLFGPAQRWASLTAAVAYLYNPYLLINVFMRGALAEACAQALLPWIFWSGRRLLGGQPQQGPPGYYVLPFACCLGGLAITHNITLLFVPPVLLGFLLLRWWSGGRSLAGLGRVTAGLLLSMGMSLFFWLPLVVERQYLTERPYTIAKDVWLPISVWRWENFLDWGLTYNHSFARPIKLGLAQLAVALAGFAVAHLVATRRKGNFAAEWWFWAAVTLVASLGVGAWVLPLWEGSNILTVAQFPWRLLSIISLPLALFAGGLVLPLVGRWQGLLALIIIALVVYAQQPRLQWLQIFPAETIDPATAVFVQVEVDKGAESGGEGNSSVQEFRPRWANTTLELDTTAVDVTPPLSVTLTHANAYGWRGVITATTPTLLRTQGFYFPGWEVTLNDQGGAPYPSTNLGLLTVDVPAGRQALQVAWVGTALQDWAGAISLITLGILVLALGWAPGQRLWALLPLLLLLGGAYARYYQPPLQPVIQPHTPVAAQGLQLLGYRLEQTADRLLLYPYWYVTQPPTEELRVRWHLQDRSGQRYSTLATLPYFNSYRASNFAIGTIVDDAYQLPLAPGMVAGEYDLSVELLHEEEVTFPLTVIGQWRLTTPIPPQHQPSHPLQVDFDKRLRLGGYDMLVGRQPVRRLLTTPAVVYNGDYLWYRLYWQASGEIEQNYHTLLHLLDHRGQPLAKQDQLPGPTFHPPMLWDRYRWQHDLFLMRLPAAAPSGLYWPVIGAYEFETVQLLPITDAATQALIATDYYRLPPVKLVNGQTQRPQHPLAIHLGDWGQIIGYSLNPSQSTIQAGEALTVTLFYRADQPVARDYTRFLHLASATPGLVAQQDSQPQAGANPTWSWQPGEIVVDSVVLHPAVAAPAGSYTLFVGFYDPQTEGERLALSQADGTPVPDNRAAIGAIEIVTD